MNMRYPHPRRVVTFVPDGQAAVDGRYWAPEAPEGAQDVRHYRLRAKAAPPIDGTIWLEPWCAACARWSCEGRCWCDDDVWGGCSGERPDGSTCRCEAVRYDPA